ncbi:MAG: hypothetical protein ABIA47_04265 [bacterium]
MTIKIEATKRGYAAMWERGGGMTSGGSAQVITGPNGEARRPVYMPRGGHLCCGDHALIGVADGFHIVSASVRRGSRDSASIRRIVTTFVKDVDGEKWEATAEVEVVNTFSRGEWDQPLDEKFVPAVEAAFRKAGIYHCRSAMYINSSEHPQRSADDKRRADERARRQEAERAAKRQAKAEREAREKAEREATSASAKVGGLGARLEAANARLSALDRMVVEMGEFSFKWGWQSWFYTEENVAQVERAAAQAEAEAVEKERERLVREAFQPKFEALKPRTEALGLTVEFGEEVVRLGGDYYGDSYSEDGLASFTAKLVQKEQEAEEARRKVQVEARYQELKAEGEAAGLPQDIEIWQRTGGATNAGNGWVVGSDGMDREPTSMYNPSSRRLQRYGEGYMVWEQILPGEVVLRWAKAYTAADHEFEVVHMPAEGLTPTQIERVAEIEATIADEWDGRTGLSSGDPSPPVGDGWGLALKPEPTPQAPATMADLMAKFNGHR